MKYVAFLRGINVGGNKKVSMADLKALCESLGFTNVKTILNSGNIVFEVAEGSSDKVTSTLEKALEQQYGYRISVMVRNLDKLRALVAANPFKNVTITPQTRLYVTFIQGKPTSKIKIPYSAPEKDFFILKLTDSEIISYLQLSPKRSTTDSMNIIEKEFGKNVTTRNWNTLLRLTMV